MFFWDPTMVLLIPAILLSMYAQFKISSAYKHYSQIRSQAGLTGAQTARALLNSKGLDDVRVERVGGRLSDHYDPRTRVINLSEDVYRSTSLASVAVAAHETGHALQDAAGYFPNASHRALALLQEGNMLGSEEIRGARSVLNAAALTYVAAALAAVLQLARLILISRGRNND